MFTELLASLVCRTDGLLAEPAGLLENPDVVMTTLSRDGWSNPSTGVVGTIQWCPLAA
jgi:hypothetical protein